MISFDVDAIEINDPLKFVVSNKAIDKISECDTDPETIFQKLSSITRLIAVYNKAHSDSFRLHTAFGSFLCKPSKDREKESYLDDDRFLITTYFENDLRNQNEALRNGVVFTVNAPIIVEVTSYDFRLRFVSGEYEEFRFDYEDHGEEAVRTIMGKFQKSTDFKKGHSNDTVDESVPISFEDQQADEMFLELLKQSEQYSILSSELEENKAKELGNIPYNAFHSVDYERKDRIAYAFSVDAFDKKTFKSGTQIEVAGRKEKKLIGEIIDINDSDKSDIQMTILFNRQVSVDDFESTGWITLSFSTVNRNVQLDANERIKSGEAKSKYMRNIFGKGLSEGFSNKDLRKVREKVSTYQYPPNDSQMRAIEKGINAKDVYLVMGPPGTGKTTVILEWVKYFVEEEHKRLLISSQNNKAVDNVLARLAEENMDILRIGSEAKVQQNVTPYLFENKLTALNQNIENATGHCLSILRRTIEDWSNYRNSLFVFRQLLSQFTMMDDDLKESINHQLQPVRIKMKQLFWDYRESTERMASMETECEQVKEAIERYLQRNSIIRFFLKWKHRKNLEKQKKLQDDIEQIREQKDIIRKDYNQLSEYYHLQRNTLKQNYVFSMSRLIKKWRKTVLEYTHQVPARPIMGDLFASISFSINHVINDDNLNRFIQCLDKEISRAKKLLNLEEQWRESIVNKQNYALNEVLLETVDLVGATCIGINSQKRFANLDFDVTIIDEAGQIQIQNALVPMSVSEKLIMLGDYQQIPPSADQELIDLCKINDIDPELLKKSLFEKMYNELPNENKMMLDTQYRIPGEIADTLSEWFYQGEYQSFVKRRGLTGVLPDISKKPFIIIDTSREKNRFESRTKEMGSYNLLEAKICQELIQYVTHSDVNLDLDEIGIISAYSDQVARIKHAISQIVVTEDANAMVATLDSFQGQERDLIIYSFTKSSKKSPARRRIGFLNELRRLNVAMSRSKKTLVMIGDMTFLSSCEHQDVDEEGNAIYAHSEKEFSTFISKMLHDVSDNDRGEIIPYAQLKKMVS